MLILGNHMFSIRSLGPTEVEVDMFNQTFGGFILVEGDGGFSGSTNIFGQKKSSGPSAQGRQDSSMSLGRRWNQKR